MLKESAKKAARREQFKKLQSNYVIDPNIGITVVHEWKVVRGFEGHYGMQLDTRPGLTKLERHALDDPFPSNG